MTKLKHSDLLKLSEEIKNASGISLSLSTLKRIFREDNTGFPQMTTLDALAIYLGYSGWIDYAREHSKAQARVKKRKWFNSIPYKRLLFLFAIVSALLVWFLIVKNNSKNKNPFTHVKFSYNSLDSIGMKVKFNFDISDVEFEKAQIWPLGSGKDACNINRYDSVLFSAYGWYDTFHPKLVIDDSVVRELTIDIQSYTWKATVCELTETEFIQESFDETEIFTQGTLGITDEMLAKHDFTYANMDNVYYCIARDFNRVHGDTLHFETRIKTRQVNKGNKDGVHIIKLAFQNGIILLPVTEKHFNINVPFAVFNVWKTHDKFDLSIFHVNSNAWNKISILTNSKIAEFRINENLIFSQEFNTEPGLLKRIEYIIYGMGEVDYVRFYNPNEEIIYNDEFD